MPVISDAHSLVENRHSQDSGLAGQPFDRSKQRVEVDHLYEKALEAMIVKVSVIPGTVWMDSVTKWPMAASSDR